MSERLSNLCGPDLSANVIDEISGLPFGHYMLLFCKTRFVVGLIFFWVKLSHGERRNNGVASHFRF